METTRIIGGEQVHFVFHIFLATRRTRWCAKSMSGFDKVEKKMDTHLLKKLIFIEFFSWEWWMKFRFLRKDRRQVQRHFCKTRKEMQHTQVQSQIFHVFGSWFSKDLVIWDVLRWTQRTMGWIGKTSCECVQSAEASNLERMYQLRKSGIEERLWTTCISTPVTHL